MQKHVIDCLSDATVHTAELEE